MTDVLTPQQRQLNMSRIRGRDTKPEMTIRRGLHARGLRYRLHDRKLPGAPDLVFAKHRAAVFVHGCFWHAHGCALSKLPASRQDFWRTKLGGNAARDSRAVDALLAGGWRVRVIWECSLRGPGRLDEAMVLDAVARTIAGSDRRPLVEFKGNSGGHGDRAEASN